MVPTFAKTATSDLSVFPLVDSNWIKYGELVAFSPTSVMKSYPMSLQLSFPSHSLIFVLRLGGKTSVSIVVGGVSGVFKYDERSVVLAAVSAAQSSGDKPRHDI